MCKVCDTCVLINNPCFCKYTGLKGVLLEEISHNIIAANLDMSNIIGEECFEKVCDKEDDSLEDLKENLNFKIIYALLIYKDWLMTNGDGHATKEGIIKKNGDDLSDFEVLSKTSINQRIENIQSKINQYKTRLMKWMSTQSFGCITATCDNSSSCSCGCQTIKNEPNICHNTTSDIDDSKKQDF